MVESPKDENIRAEIIAAAQKLFQQYGYLKTTMEDIAKAVHKGKSTLYHYYASKDDVFNALIYAEIDDVFDAIKEAVDKKVTALEKIDTYLRVSITEVRKKINLYRILKGEIGEDSVRINSLIYAFNDAELDLLSKILKFGVESGEMIRISDEEIESIAYVINSALRSHCFNLVVSEKPLDLDKQTDLMSSLLIRGIKA